MTDPKKKRPTPTGAWVTVNNPGPGDVLIQRWDPNAEPLRTERDRSRAARRVARAHLRPWPITSDWMIDRLMDVVTAHGLPGWRADTYQDQQGHAWASVGWTSPDGTEKSIRARYGRTAPARISSLIAAARSEETRP